MICVEANNPENSPKKSMYIALPEDLRKVGCSQHLPSATRVVCFLNPAHIDHIEARNCGGVVQKVTAAAETAAAAKAKAKTKAKAEAASTTSSTCTGVIPRIQIRSPFTTVPVYSTPPATSAASTTSAPSATSGVKPKPTLKELQTGIPDLTPAPTSTIAATTTPSSTAYGQLQQDNSLWQEPF